MTTTQKTLVAAALAVVTGTGVYEGRQLTCLKSEASMLQQQQAPLKEQIRRLRQERDEVTNRLALLVEENTRWQANSNELLKLRSEVGLLRQDSEQLKAFRSLQSGDPQAAPLVAWLDRVQRLKERLAENPRASIPELASLTEEEWLEATAAPLELKSEKDYRYALSRLRNSAEIHYLEPLQAAVTEFTKANDGKWPTDLAQVKSYLKTPIEEAILQRYEIVRADTLPTRIPMSGWVVTEKAPVDLEYDVRQMAGSDCFSTISFKDSEMFKTLTPAIQAYYAANNGQAPEDADLAKFAPYVRTPEEQAALASAIKEYESAPRGIRGDALDVIKNLKPK